MTCHKTSPWPPAASLLRWAQKPWSHLRSWHGATHVASSCRPCPRAKPKTSLPPLPTQAAAAVPPGQGQSLQVRVQSLSFCGFSVPLPAHARAGEGPCDREGWGSPPSHGAGTIMGWAGQNRSCKH